MNYTMNQTVSSEQWTQSSTGQLAPGVRARNHDGCQDAAHCSRYILGDGAWAPWREETLRGRARVAAWLRLHAPLMPLPVADALSAGNDGDAGVSVRGGLGAGQARIFDPSASDLEHLLAAPITL